MATRNYERLSIEEFGSNLLESGDLDPIYIALYDGNFESIEQRHRWLVAYWAFYHAGVASFMSEKKGKHFWNWMMKAAVNEKPNPMTHERWPRSKERRHARGHQGIKMVQELSIQYPAPEDMVKQLLEHNALGHTSYIDMARPIKNHYLFGPWIVFKINDMLERVEEANIDFSEADVFMFKDPVKAAIMVYKQKQEEKGIIINEVKDEMEAVRPVVNYLAAEFAECKAPPRYDRYVDLQEIETILCKVKSHWNGHYPLYNDITEIDEGLVGWGDTAEMFRAAMPEGIQ